ncbi:MAG: ribosome maturation factor RimP [bacterium]|nr:ribosome maturation factor RimP [bacterium]
MGSLADRLWSQVESYVAAEHLELDDLEVLGEGSGRIVRVTLDGETLEVSRIADLSRGLSRMFDEIDPFEGSYTLEVSSPGLERKLRRPRHYEKSIGSEIKVKTFAPVAGGRTHSGVLTQADDSSFTLEVDGEQRKIGYDAVASARTVFVWKKAAKPGSRS